jgi:hypothetical protein
MRALTTALALLAVLVAGPSQAAKKCAPDSVASGPACVDRYEASVWSVPSPTTSNKGLVRKIRKGTVRLADLERAGAVRLGCDESELPAFPASFPPDGAWQPLPGTDPPTPGVYAASVAGALPTACVTWFQADQACALSGKRLLTNAEWQRAAAGTIDPAVAEPSRSCNVGGLPSLTGARELCVSLYGARDMIGNVAEWTAEWRDRNTGECSANFGEDAICFGGSGAVPVPGAVIRGGDRNDGREAGSFAIRTATSPDEQAPDVGFRCAR